MYWPAVTSLKAILLLFFFVSDARIHQFFAPTNFDHRYFIIQKKLFVIGLNFRWNFTQNLPSVNWSMIVFTCRIESNWNVDGWKISMENEEKVWWLWENQEDIEIGELLSGKERKWNRLMFIYTLIPFFSLLSISNSYSFVFSSWIRFFSAHTDLCTNKKKKKRKI